MEAKMRQKSDQDGTKIEDKNPDEKRSSSRPSWGRLEPILGRLGARLGALETRQTRRLPMFREQPRFGKNEVSRGDLGRTWADLEVIWMPKRLQNGAQEGAKTERKKRRKME